MEFSKAQIRCQLKLKYAASRGTGTSKNVPFTYMFETSSLYTVSSLFIHTGWKFCKPSCSCNFKSGFLTLEHLFQTEVLH